jgi:hypothetical protein
MGFFSNLFGMNKVEKAKIVGSIDVMAAINAHVRWKARLEEYLNGTSEEKLDPKVICLDNQCVLGKWIHGPAQEFFLEDDGYRTLREDHAKFHLIAATVVTKIHANEKAAAEALIKGEYGMASRKVVKDLTEMGKQLIA